MEALARGYLVRYSTLDDLVRGLRHADALGKLPSKLAQLQRPHLLILDEAGYLPLDRADANRVFEVVNRRYTRGSTIVTSNKTVAEWADTFGDEALAAAILDRLLHDAEEPTINGPTYRRKGRLDAPPPAPRRTRQPHRLTLTDPTDRCSSTDNFRWPSTDIFRWLLTNGLPACVLPTEAPVPDHPTLRPEPDRDFAVHFHATRVSDFLCRRG